MTEKVYRINNAGLWAMGHYGVTCVRLELGHPHTCMVLEMSVEKSVALLNELRIDHEDGEYLHECLIGQNVLVRFDEDERAYAIGDPYGNSCVSLRGGDE